MAGIGAGLLRDLLRRSFHHVPALVAAFGGQVEAPVAFDARLGFARRLLRMSGVDSPFATGIFDRFQQRALGRRPPLAAVAGNLERAVLRLVGGAAAGDVGGEFFQRNRFAFSL